MNYQEQLRLHIDLIASNYDLIEIIETATEMLEEEIAQFDCMDCDINTMENEEYYMVTDNLWFSVVPDGQGMLCFSCLEKRIGRTLAWEDFTDAPINSMWKAHKIYGR